MSNTTRKRGKGCCIRRNDMEIKISEENLNQRLDKFLTAQLSLTRSQIKKLILGGSVSVNQKPAAVHRFLKIGDVIEIRKKKKHKPILEKPFVTGLFPKIKIIA